MIFQYHIPITCLQDYFNGLAKILATDKSVIKSF